MRPFVPHVYDVTCPKCRARKHKVCREGQPAMQSPPHAERIKKAKEFKAKKGA